MAHIEQIIVPDDGVFPNSALAALLYKGALDIPVFFPATHVSHLFAKHGWSNSWDAGIFEYHHYHSVTHEVLGIYWGKTVLQLGGPNGKKIVVEEGDVLVIPAGLAHKNLFAQDNIGVVGAYPDGRDYDMNYGKPGERPTTDENIARVPLPSKDPLGLRNGPTKLWSKLSKKINKTMAKFSEKAGDKVEKSTHEMKEGKLKSGSGKKVTSKKQAVAIGLSEARKEGAKVPKKKS